MIWSFQNSLSHGFFCGNKSLEEIQTCTVWKIWTLKLFSGTLTVEINFWTSESSYTGNFFKYSNIFYGKFTIKGQTRENGNQKSRIEPRKLKLGVRTYFELNFCKKIVCNDSQVRSHIFWLLYRNFFRKHVNFCCITPIRKFSVSPTDLESYFLKECYSLFLYGNRYI